ncbi:hypothetical protein U1Q18_000338 [Sarracenia purpurea var. burkii]
MHRTFIRVHNLLLKKTSSHRNLVYLMCSRGRVPLAPSVKELLLKESNPPDLIVYNILIFHLFQTQYSLFVDSLLDELHDKGLQFDGFTYNFLVYGYGRVEKAVNLLNVMLKKGNILSSSSYDSLIQGFL